MVYSKREQITEKNVLILFQNVQKVYKYKMRFRVLLQLKSVQCFEGLHQSHKWYEKVRKWIHQNKSIGSRQMFWEEEIFLKDGSFKVHLIKISHLENHHEEVQKENKMMPKKFVQVTKNYLK